MAHLADIDSKLRSFGKIAAVAAVALSILFILITGGQFFKNLLFPTPPAPPTEKFGQLPPLDFPPQTPKKLSYNINTLSGELPQLPQRMNVYEVQQPETSLVALKEAREILRGAGFEQNEIKINQSTYQWTNIDNNTNVQYNIDTKNFKITSDLLGSPPKILSGVASSRDGAYETVTSFIQSLGANTENIDFEKTTVTFLKVQDGNLVGTASQNEAQYLRLDLFPKDVNKFPVYYPGNKESLMHFIIKSEDFNPQVVEGSYSNPIPNSKSASDYYIISAESALNKLKKGDGLIFNNNQSETIDITDVTLGYYVTSEQQYFMPVVVFSGKNFLGIVNAIQTQ